MRTNPLTVAETTTVRTQKGMSGAEGRRGE